MTAAKITKTISMILPIMKKVNRRNGHINVLLDGRPVIYKYGPYILNNNIYLPLDELIKTSEMNINLEGSYKVINGIKYAALIDIVNLWNLRTVWDYSSKTINMYRSDERIQKRAAINSRGTALIRLEDVTAGPPYDTSEAKEKLRIIADYLYSMSVPFHIAWIPRYINPLNKADNDISRDCSFSNADFLFTLKYMISRGGIIGLHGYTHQYGNEVSGDGTEFSKGRNEDERSIRRRLEAAIKIADAVGIPYKFFESPHYASTEFQQSIMEQYFDFIYEPYVGIWGDEITKSPRNNRTKYVPTPLDYISEPNSLTAMLLKIKMLKEGKIASFFYHPYKEMDYIILKRDKNGYPDYTYFKTSVLHKLVNAVLKKGYEFKSITEL